MEEPRSWAECESSAPHWSLRGLTRGRLAEASGADKSNGSDHARPRGEVSDAISRSIDERAAGARAG